MLRTRTERQGFTLLEVLVVIAILALILGITLPSLSKARDTSKSAICLTHLRTLGQGWGMYSDENRDTMLPARLPKHTPGGFANAANHYTISTGQKYRPRWPALMQQQVGVPALKKPLTYRDRQNYDDPVYVCPSVPEWKDERNAAYGYNYQFLGSARIAKDKERLLASRSRLKKPADTVVIADSNGSAASFPTRQRMIYENADRDPHRRGNYGWLIDPPRLEKGSSRAGGPGTPRSAPDSRHRNKAGVVFADGHTSLLSLLELGYGVESDGRVVDEGHGATNRLFSGTGEDHNPP